MYDQLLTKNKPLQIPALLVTIALMLLFPYLIHLIGGPTAGGRWLPIFYAPFVAALLFQPVVAIVAALSAPFLNHLLTGAPALPMAVVLSVELLVFVLLARQMARRWPAFWGAAPLAYLLAKLSSTLLLAILPVTLLPLSPGQFLSSSLAAAWPGLLVLLFINWLTVRGLRRGA
jgi:hypothetical protein